MNNRVRRTRAGALRENVTSMAAQSKKRRRSEFRAPTSKGWMPLHIRVVSVERGQFFLGHELIPCRDGAWNGQPVRCLKVEGYNLLGLNGNCVGA